MSSRGTLLLSAVVCAALAACNASGGASASDAYEDARGFGQLFGNKPIGSWTHKYAGGAVQAKGSYVKGGDPDGPWTIWYENGQKEWEGIFAAHHRQGPSTSYHPGGQKLAEGTYEKGRADGGWTFYDENGKRHQSGEFVDGVPEGRWTYWHADGKPLAEGIRIGGERAGMWQFFDAQGQRYEQSFPVPAGAAIVRENREIGGYWREGVKRAGAKSARWITWHQNGMRRAAGRTERGQPNGLWQVWSPSGELIARGEMKDGKPSGRWTLWSNGRATELMGYELPKSPPAGPGTAGDELAAQDVKKAVSAWLAEAALPPASKSDAPVDHGAGTPPETLAAVTAPPAEVPIASVPWDGSRASQANLAKLTELYRHKPPPGAAGMYGSSEPEVRGPDNSRTQPLIGKPLAHTKLTYGTGQTLDLAHYRGKKRVLLVVLRGFDGRVCEYCETQTMALQGYVERFNALNTEVVVCYPGPQNALRAFIKQFGELPESNGPPTVTLTYDPGYKIIEALDISGQIALPTTLILDEQGVIRYAYVGLDAKDRPSADDLVFFVERRMASNQP